MQTRFWLVLAAFTALPTVHVAAHHSPTLLYDLSREITVTGTVTRYDLGNPHMRIYFDVDNNGTIEKWRAEGGSHTQLARAGWTATTVLRGDKVTVRGHPAREAGRHLIHMEYLTLPDGKERFAEDVRYEQF